MEIAQHDEWYCVFLQSQLLMGFLMSEPVDLDDHKIDKV